MNAKEILEKLIDLEIRQASLARKALAETDEARQDQYDAWWDSTNEEIEALQNQLAGLWGGKQ